ncbi:MAG TPA: glycosyltransferase 87 family protein [Ktedonobacterales bacterium]|nr:glycosyltransferase 87 family protein [Ktedonobacterales bacterium]
MYRSSAQIKRFLFSREGALFIVLFMAAMLIRIPLMTFRGYYADLSTYLRWGETVTQHFTSIYTTAATGSGFPGNPGGGFPGGFGGPPGGPGGFPSGGSGGLPGASFNSAINYPPATPYLFGAIVYLYNQFLEPSFHASLSTLAATNGIGPFLAKLPLLLADIAAFVYLSVQARKRHSAAFALIVSASYAFSPALLYNGAVWGQTDGFVSFPLLVALFSLLSESYVLAGISLALAILLKPQPVIFVPLILLYLARWTDWKRLLRFAAAALLMVLLFLLPILIPHFQLVAMLNNMQTTSYSDNALLTSNAFNFWWLIGYAHQSIGSTFLGIKSGTVGTLLFVGVTLVSAIQIWRHRQPLALCLGLAVQAFGFFLFMGGQHERYLFFFIPLALASVILAPRSSRPHLVALYILGTLLCFLNMGVGVGGGSFGNSQPIPFASLPSLSSYLSANFDAVGQFLALLHLITFCYLLAVYLTQRYEPATRSGPEETPTLAITGSQAGNAAQSSPVLL